MIKFLNVMFQTPRRRDFGIAFFACILKARLVDFNVTLVKCKNDVYRPETPFDDAVSQSMSVQAIVRRA